jgi:NTP pyrophosphatase (non-canonical NTP hydrolase)
MEIKDFQEKVLASFSEVAKAPNRRPHTKQSAIIHLTEELGEIARQVNNEFHRPEKFNKENLGEELADLMMFIAVIADLYDIDLSQKMKASIEKVKQVSIKLNQNKSDL